MIKLTLKALSIFLQKINRFRATAAVSTLKNVINIETSKLTVADEHIKTLKKNRIAFYEQLCFQLPCIILEKSRLIND